MTPDSFPTYEDFAGREGDAIDVGGPGVDGSVALTLTEVEAWDAPWQPGGRQPFTLHLTGPADVVLAQGSYRFEHPSVGVVELFMVPLGPGPDGFRYEVILT